MGTEAFHRALVRFAQNELGRDVSVPNDCGFENFGWPSLGQVREALEGLGIGYGVETDHPGRFYEHPAIRSLVGWDRRSATPRRLDASGVAHHPRALRLTHLPSHSSRTGPEAASAAGLGS
jgi:hypothetical protein